MYDERILREFPTQFQGKEHIQVLVRAFTRQLDELLRVFEDLKHLRSLDTAQGKLLDGVGDIVVLSRSDAMRLIKGKIKYDIMDDDHYRHYLKYKILKNTSTCTYYDMIAAVQMLWGVDDIEYFEDPTEPAAVTLSFPEPDMEFDEVPPIKAAGVGLHIKLTKEVQSAAHVRVGTIHTISTRIAVPPVSAVGSRSRAGIRAGCCPVQYARLVIRPYDGIEKRQSAARIMAVCSATEFVRVKIPAYKGEF